jgi:hypothetical protein
VRLKKALGSDEGKKTTIEDGFIKRRITERPKSLLTAY